MGRPEQNQGPWALWGLPPPGWGLVEAVCQISEGTWVLGCQVGPRSVPVHSRVSCVSTGHSMSRPGCCSSIPWGPCPPQTLGTACIWLGAGGAMASLASPPAPSKKGGQQCSWDHEVKDMDLGQGRDLLCVSHHLQWHCGTHCLPPSPQCSGSGARSRGVGLQLGLCAPEATS